MRTYNSPFALQVAYKDPKFARMRFKDIATHLAVSEAELLATKISPQIQRLHITDWGALVTLLNSFEEQMALSRNAFAVSEFDGALPQLSLHTDATGNISLVGQSEFCRLDYQVKDWRIAFAAVEPVRGKLRASLHFFDAFGEAVHKRYFPESFPMDKFLDLIAPFTANDQSIYQSVAPPALSNRYQLSPYALSLLAENWKKLGTELDFCTLYENLLVHNRYALARSLCTLNLAYRIHFQQFRELCTTLQQAQLPIQVEVSNAAAYHTYMGILTRLVDVEQWFNFIEPDFNLHLWVPGIQAIYIIPRTTNEVVVELYDMDCNLILLLRAVTAETGAVFKRYI